MPLSPVDKNTNPQNPQEPTKASVLLFPSACLTKPRGRRRRRRRLHLAATADATVDVNIHTWPPPSTTKPDCSRDRGGGVAAHHRRPLPRLRSSSTPLHILLFFEKPRIHHHQKQLKVFIHGDAAII
ncbi:unnamed protein product [Urochloa humidicola]